MEKIELRPFVFEALRKHHSSQYGNVSHDVAQLCDEYVEPRDGGKVVEIVWDLLIQGVLAPGHGGAHVQSSSFFHVTPYGRECLAAGDVIPQDPDGYMARLRERIGPNLDDVVATYVHESLLTFVARRYLASAVMLGVASERCVDLLASQLVESLRQSDGGAALEKKLGHAGRSVKQRFDLIREHLLQAELPIDLKDALDVQLSGIFTLIRYTRNDAGHPTGRSVDREIANANLQLFPGYCERVYGLVRHLAAAEDSQDSA